MAKSAINFFTELRRRRVLPVAGAYIAFAWLVTEIASFLYAVQKRIDGDLKTAESLINTAIELRPGNRRYRAELTEILRLQKLEEEST